VNYRTRAHEAIAKAFNGAFYGYIPDSDVKRRQKDSRLRFGATPAAPNAASLATFRAPIMDQGPLGSCTGHGTAQAVFTAAAAAGAPLPFVPSPDLLYKLVRVLERQSAATALTDSGAMPSDILTVLRLYGVKAIAAPTSDGRYSDCDPATVNDEPDLLSMEAAGLKLLTGEYRVDETAADFGAQLRAAIAAKHTAGIGVFVDSAFMAYDGSSPVSVVNLSDPNGGGHWLSLDYYYQTGYGYVYGGPNSWGGAWGKAGCYEITETCLASIVSDILLFPVTVVP